MGNLIKQSKIIYLFLTVSFISLASCSKNEVIAKQEVEETDLVFESFILEKKNNPYLKEDVVFNIDNGSISGTLKTYFFNSIPTFTTNAQSVKIDNLEQVSASSTVDFRTPITYSLKSESGATKTYTVNISWDDALAHIYIETEGAAPIVSKDDYLNAKLTIDGQSKYEDRVFEFSENARIKGRGNSTWAWPKKPFKIKLDSKETLVSHKDALSRLLPEKDWVLLADYQDGVHLLNNVAFTIGRMLDMPFTNTIIPVELTLNGNYLGVYGLTEQLEIKTNRVNVGKDGLLLELDQYYDEDWQFRSANYNLPVMVKDPDLDTQAELDAIKSEWNTFEALVASNDFPNNNYLDFIDGESIAKYFIVNMLTSNQEINHPKSTYLHKTATGKYTMGPLWDFDWAYGFEGSSRHFSNPNKDLFWTDAKAGTTFFKKLMLTDPKIKVLIKEHWLDFTSNHLDDLMDYIDEHAFIIKGAKARNLNMWNNGLVTDELIMKQWLQNRVLYINNYINNF
ncbi:CotH kinase family protein [Gelatiniphilus marinus]|uniref:CotH kinase family protein n=1 Tax=Gelatiniphilus marinus TaxID=1759464 RepID=A0ABW5JQK7_9FLAO